MPNRLVSRIIIPMKSFLLPLLLILVVIVTGNARPLPVYGLDCTDMRVLPRYAENALMIEGVITTLNPTSGMGKRDRLKNFLADRAVAIGISLEIGGQTLVATTTAEGILTATATPLIPQGRVTLKDPRSGRVFSRREFVFPLKPTYLLISDVDDTILESNVAHKVRLVLKTLFRSVRNRQPVAGTPELYRSLVPTSPPHPGPLIFYLSASPSALEKFLEKFLERNRFPQGILCLKDSFQKDGFSSRDYKERWLKRLKSLYPDLPWLLFGDSGELDPEIYLDILEAENVTAKAVIIHEVAGKKRTPQEWKRLHERAAARGTPLILWKDLPTLQREMAGHGLVGCTTPLPENPTNPY